MITLLLLFIEFFKIGLFAIGGGLATLPFLINLSQIHPEWISMADISNMIAVSESTPGPLGINMATFVGNNVGQAIFGCSLGGIFGGIIATLGEVAPSIIIILVISKVLGKFKQSKYVSWAFYGLRAIVISLIAYAAWGVYKIALFSNSSIKVAETMLFAIILIGMLKLKKIHPTIWILIAAILGIILKMPTLS